MVNTQTPAELATEPCKSAPRTSTEAPINKEPYTLCPSTYGETIELECAGPSIDDFCSPPLTPLVEDMDRNSSSDLTSPASLGSTPLAVQSCKRCTHKAKYHNLLRANKRLKEKVSALKKEMFSLKDTITELEC